MTAAAAAAAALLGATPAFADKIDGDWCSPKGDHVKIDGPKIVTVKGATVAGDYFRHWFTFTPPAGEPGGGASVTLRLVDPDTIRWGEAADAVLWRRCDFTS
ncbi:MAG: hypothetical protein KGI57_00455 [Hyphomicrobiales bacterium]|nr:hypothetical protein [Hyphomicrobiales bacterium]MDE2016155.1 hypothetical protein [Hyphomicrobiales bacterium]